MANVVKLYDMYKSLHKNEPFYPFLLSSPKIAEQTMYIIIDKNIPFLYDALTSMGHKVDAMPGTAISKADVEHAEALFVRTRTECNASLLEGSKVRFIGTATIGYDHIDSDYCKQRGIEWVSAPGCNADAVLQYVQSSLYIWSKENGVQLHNLTLGIVGVGRIGSRIASWAKGIGMRVLLNDPPREATGEKGFVSLHDIAKECDIITFHPTLQKDGMFPSYHLADSAFFYSLQRKPLLINASRGGVADNRALLVALEEGAVSDAIIDVWEGEPDINITLLNKVYIGTPHIAGYSAEGKLNASRMMLQAFAKFTGSNNAIPEISLPAPENVIIAASDEQNAFLQIYNPKNDSEQLKSSPDQFEQLRNNYQLRREPKAYDIRFK